VPTAAAGRLEVIVTFASGPLAGDLSARRARVVR